MKRIFVFLYLLSILAFLPQAYVHAHGEAGMTIVGTVGTFTGDVDYDNTFIQADVPGRFVFNLFSGDKVDVVGTGVEFDDLWVRFVKKTETSNGTMIFAGPIDRPLFGGAGMTITIPEPGDYTIFVRYNKDDKKIVEISYDFTAFELVTEKPFAFEKEFFVGVGGGFTGALILGLITMGVYRVSRKKQTITK